MMKPLTDLELLRGAPVGHLRQIIETRRLALPGAGDLDLEDTARRLFHEPSLREALRGLSPPQWAILRELARCGGQAANLDLRAYLIAAGLIPGSGRAPEARISLYELALGRLLALGLVFWGRLDMLGAREYASGAHEGVLVVPPSVLALLAASDLAEQEAPASHWQPRAPRAGSAEAFQRDLYLYWRAVREQPGGLTLLANGQLPKAALRPLNAALSLKTELDGIRSEQEAGRLFFLRLLAQALGLLAVRGKTLYAVDAAAFFAQSVAERTRQAFIAWRAGTFWNELLHLPGVTLRSPPETTPAEVPEARQVALRLLSEEAASGWVSRAALLALARLRQPYFLLARRGRGHMDPSTAAGNPFGLELRSRGGWLSPQERWLRLEGAFLAALLEGPLFWLGAVDLDEAPSGEVSAYHLAPVGLALVGRGAWPPALTETTGGRLVIQPNFEALALPPVREALLYVLDPLAERQSLEQVALYRLTRERWLSALQQEQSATALIERLERLTETPLPQNIRYSLLEWERQAQRVRLSRGVALLEVREAALLDALLADAALAALIRRRLTPTAALVDRQQLARLYELLLERGQVPQRRQPR